MSATFIATASEAYVRQALAELRGLDPQIGTIRALGPGVIRFTTSPALDRAGFLAHLLVREPVFVRHVHPADVQVPLAGGPDALEAAAAVLLGNVRPGESIAVQVRRYSEGGGGLDRGAVREHLDGSVTRAGGTPVTQGADRILSVTLDEETAYLGLSTPTENLSDWPGGEIRFRREEEQVSRAKFKLLEVFERFGLKMHPGGHALDLGAAPGGWTSLLLERGLQVTAIDTGDLSPTLAGHEHLTFIRQNVDDVRFPPDCFDLITCDVSWNPLHTARMVARLAPSARPGAHLILTVKLMLQNPTRTIRLVGEALSEAYDLLRVKHLYHNRDEVTMLLRRK